MSLEAILEQILQASDAQAKALRIQAEGEAEGVLAEARNRAEQLYQEAYRQALAPAVGMCARILNQAHFEAECRVGHVQEELVNMTLDGVRTQMSEMRHTELYLPAMRRILLEVLPGENGLYDLNERVILEADPRDRDLIEALLQERGLAIRVDYCLTCWGGLCAHSVNGTTRLINTLESRLERALPFLKQRLLAVFEGLSAGEQEEVLFEDVRL